MTLISSKSLTLAEFLSLTAPDGDITYELVDGEAIRKNVTEILSFSFNCWLYLLYSITGIKDGEKWESNGQLF
jgi:Uma2 family endonuclease